MGHSDKVHKDYYRQPIIARDIVNMSKLLEMAQGVDSTSSFSNSKHHSEKFIQEKNETPEPPKKKEKATWYVPYLLLEDK